MDNDVALVARTFGFLTAVQEADAAASQALESEFASRRRELTSVTPGRTVMGARYSPGRTSIVSPADAAAIGAVLIPAMIERGYDRDFAAANALKADVTPEAFVLDRNFVLRYRGRIDNAYYARLKKNQQVTTNELRQVLDGVDRHILDQRGFWRIHSRDVDRLDTPVAGQRQPARFSAGNSCLPR